MVNSTTRAVSAIFCPNLNVARNATPSLSK